VGIFRDPDVLAKFREVGVVLVMHGLHLQPHPTFWLKYSRCAIQ